jgi:DNA-binding transcriptional LysR family regulator
MLPFIDRTSDVSYEAELGRWMKEHRIRRHSGLLINDVDTILQMVERNMGWTVIPEICLSEFNGIVEKLTFEDGTPFKRRTHLLYRPDYFQLPQVQAFVEAVKEFNCNRSVKLL